MIKWFKKMAASIALATASVEKNALSQNAGSLEDGSNIQQSKDQGSLLNALKQGRITQQVQELRARTYLVMEKAQNIYSKGTPVLDEDGNIIAMTADNTQKNITAIPKEIKGDPFDDYKIQMVVSNDQTTLSLLDTVDYFKVSDEKARAIGGGVKDENAVEMTRGEEFKNEEPIVITRKGISRFRIEQYTKKMYVRVIDKETRLLEFYVSMYETEDKRSKFFLNAVKKLIANPLNRELVDIDTVSFVSYKTLGSYDFRSYEYQVTEFDKIVEHNGFYIFKFKANVTDDGTDLLAEFKEELSDKYKNKEKREAESIGVDINEFYNNNEEFYHNINDDDKEKTK